MWHDAWDMCVTQLPGLLHRGLRLRSVLRTGTLPVSSSRLTHRHLAPGPAGVLHERPAQMPVCAPRGSCTQARKDNTAQRARCERGNQAQVTLSVSMASATATQAVKEDPPGAGHQQRADGKCAHRGRGARAGVHPVRRRARRRARHPAGLPGARAAQHSWGPRQSQQQKDQQSCPQVDAGCAGSCCNPLSATEHPAQLLVLVHDAPCTLPQVGAGYLVSEHSDHRGEALAHAAKAPQTGTPTLSAVGSPVSDSSSG